MLEDSGTFAVQTLHAAARCLLNQNIAFQIFTRKDVSKSISLDVAMPEREHVCSCFGNLGDLGAGPQFSFLKICATELLHSAQWVILMKKVTSCL